MQISLTCSERWKVNFIYVFLSADLVLPSLFAKSKTTHELSPQLPQGSFQRKASGSSTGVESDPKLIRNQFVQIGSYLPTGGPARLGRAIQPSGSQPCSAPSASTGHFKGLQEVRACAEPSPQRTRSLEKGRERGGCRGP